MTSGPNCLQLRIGPPDSGVTCCYGEYGDFLPGGYMNGGGYYARHNIQKVSQESAKASLGNT